MELRRGGPRADGIAVTLYEMLGGQNRRRIRLEHSHSVTVTTGSRVKINQPTDLKGASSRGLSAGPISPQQPAPPDRLLWRRRGHSRALARPRHGSRGQAAG